MASIGEIEVTLHADTSEVERAIIRLSASIAAFEHRRELARARRDKVWNRHQMVGAR